MNIPDILRTPEGNIELDPEVGAYIKLVSDRCMEVSKERDSLKIENFKLQGKINRMNKSSWIERLLKIGKWNWE